MTEDNKRILLERSANRARARLADTLEALDHKRHSLLDVRHQVDKQVHAHWRPLVAVGATGAATLGTILGVSIYWAATRRERLRRERWSALRRLWFHPERLARKEEPRGSLAWSVARKVLSATLTYVAMEATKRAIQAALPPPRPTSNLDELRRAEVVVRTLPA